jgi:hypothetical protein
VYFFFFLGGGGMTVAPPVQPTQFRHSRLKPQSSRCGRLAATNGSDVAAIDDTNSSSGGE